GYFSVFQKNNHFFKSMEKHKSRACNLAKKCKKKEDDYFLVTPNGARRRGVKRGKRWAADNTNSQFRHSLPPPIFSLSLPVSVQPPLRRERSERAESPAKRLAIGR
ncbi:MAG: hypothetical protein J6T13_06715, partial [Bacteroidales bacterium]|nr:hypothetical protein [Bacteroidales bacterium]